MDLSVRNNLLVFKNKLFSTVCTQIIQPGARHQKFLAGGRWEVRADYCSQWALSERKLIKWKKKPQKPPQKALPPLVNNKMRTHLNYSAMKSASPYGTEYNKYVICWFLGKENVVEYPLCKNHIFMSLLKSSWTLNQSTNSQDHHNQSRQSIYLLRETSVKEFLLSLISSWQALLH